MKKFTFAILTSAVLGGCASTNSGTTNDNVVNYPDYIGKTPVYAKLVKGDDGRYIFETLQSGFVGSNDNVVKLNDLKPTWNTSIERDCLLGTSTMMVTSKLSKCTTANDELFRVSMMDGAQMFANGLNLIASHGLSGTSRGTNIAFDKEKYMAAVKSAIVNSNLDIESIIGQVDAAMSKNKAKIDENLLKIEKLNSDGIKFKDKTGLISNAGDLLYDLVKVEAPITYKVTLAEKELLGSKVEDAVNLSTKNYIVACEDYSSSENEYITVDIECPSVVASNIETIEPVITSYSLSKVPLLPFLESDDVVAISLEEDNSLKVQNLSNDYVLISGISAYVVKDVHAMEKSIHLPPKSNQNIKMPVLQNASLLESKNDYSKDEALADLVTYGFAVRYRVSGSNSDATLFKVNEYTGVELIEHYNKNKGLGI